MGNSAHALWESLQLSGIGLRPFIGVVDFAVGRDLDLFDLLILLLVLLARRMFLPQGGKVPQVPSGTTGGDA